jgi:hypothetical protein
VLLGRQRVVGEVRVGFFSIDGVGMDAASVETF